MESNTADGYGWGEALQECAPSVHDSCRYFLGAGGEMFLELIHVLPELLMRLVAASTTLPSVLRATAKW